jgi:hypothetical protein
MLISIIFLAHVTELLRIPNQAEKASLQQTILHGFIKTKEISRMKSWLKEHAHWIDENIELL